MGPSRHTHHVVVNFGPTQNLWLPLYLWISGAVIPQFEADQE